MSDFKNLTISVDGNVAHVELARPEKKNALSMDLMRELVEAPEVLAANSDIRAVVLSGAGGDFCAGLDKANFSLMMSDPNAFPPLKPRTHGISNLYQKVVYGWRELPVPVIAAIDGVVLGGGFQLALGADIRLVTADARFSILEIKWGLIPDMAGTPLMRTMARDDVIRELTYTGRIFSGSEAVDFGFATRVCANPLEDAMSLAGEIAGKNPHAIEAAKRIFNVGVDQTTAEALMMESIEQDKLTGSENQVESITAAMQSRAANYKNAR